MTDKDTGPVPEWIGKYRVDQVIGAGAMGIVYKGFDTAIERDVAIKTIRAELLDEEEAGVWRERFAREVRAAARCLHANVVTIYDFGEAGGAPYIAMEYCVGRPLSDFMKARQVFDVRTALYVAGQTLAALSAAHQRGIVHRDVKPGNILVLDSGVVKVTDFGIARLESSTMTAHGSMVGTPKYMAPEQFIGGDVDHRVDLYGLGVILYEMLTGQRPFDGRNSAEIIYRVMNEQPKPPSALNRAITPALEETMMRALAREPAGRFDTADLFADALAGTTGDEQAATIIAPARGAAAPRPDEGFDPETLAQVEHRLARHVGPIAKVMVRKAAARTSSLEALHDALAEAIDDPEVARAFRRGGGGSGTGGGSRSGTTGRGSGASRHESRAGRSGGGGPLVLDPETVTRTQQSLASHLGPVARVLVRKAAEKAGSLDEFYRILAENIPDERERTAFLRRHIGSSR